MRSLLAAGASRLLLIDDETGEDGKSRGAVAALRAEFPGLEVLRTPAPAYWTGAIALGIRHCLARGDPSVLFFNQDVTVAKDYFARLSESAATFPGALIGSAVVYASAPGTVWSGGGGVEWFGRGIRVLYHGAPVSDLPAAPYPVDWLFGMGTLVPCEVFARIGLPDAVRFPMAWGDADFSLRARRAGISLMLDPSARLFHEVGEYDARVAGPPTARRYVGWLRDPKNNLSLESHAEIFRRHGPRILWPLSLAMRVVFLLANYIRIRVLFPGEGREDS